MGKDQDRLRQLKLMSPGATTPNPRFLISRKACLLPNIPTGPHSCPLLGPLTEGAQVQVLALPITACLGEEGAVPTFSGTV